MALGDKAAADRALDFLFNVQQKPDGSFPQNSYLDGKPFWGSLQMDEVAFPLILAYQFGRYDKATWENHVKKAADFIVKNGPKTPQERWEEEGGYSPSTIAAEIAGLSLRGGNRQEKRRRNFGKSLSENRRRMAGEYRKMDGNDEREIIEIAVLRPHHAERQTGRGRKDRTQQRRGIF